MSASVREFCDRGGLGRFVFTLLVCSGMLTSAVAADWPNWRGRNHDGVSTESDWSASWPEAGPTVLWENSLGIGFSSFVVSDGRAYCMGNREDRDTVYCFAADSGKVLWTHDYPQRLDAKYYEGGTLSTPTVADGQVFVISKDGKVFALTVASGDAVWTRDLKEAMGLDRSKWGYSCSPLVVDDLIILNAGTWGVALNKTDGSVAWENGKEKPGYSTAVPYVRGGVTCVAIAGREHVFGLEARTGERRWTFEWKTRHDVNAADPIIEGNKVFVSSGYGHGSVLLELTDDGVRETWSNRNMRNKMNPSVLFKEHIYGVSEIGHLRCLKLSTGDVAWSEGGFGHGSLMIAGGRLIVLGGKGRLVVAEATPGGYKELASAEVLDGRCWTVPVLANGLLYMRNAKGAARCLDLR